MLGTTRFRFDRSVRSDGKKVFQDLPDFRFKSKYNIRSIGDSE